MHVSEERDAALDRFFEGAASERSSGDAVAQVAEALEALTAALATGSALGDEYGTPTRKEADRAVRVAAFVLGKAAVDALRGLVLSGVAAETVMLRRAAMDHDAPPLDASWRQQADRYSTLATMAATQKERLTRLAQEPNQLYRGLHDSVALAADAAAWTAWVDAE
jgi:hypothetical protein